jgi:hypothetical protein
VAAPLLRWSPTGRLGRLVPTYRRTVTPDLPKAWRLVHDAARRLDVAAPGWWRRVDVVALDVSDARRCPLAQVFGDYERGLRVLYDGAEPRESLAFTSHVPTVLWRVEIGHRVELARTEVSAW